MFDPFAGIEGQRQLAEYLATALETGRITHAYLIVGAPACGSDEIARRFAAAVVSSGDEAEFETALRGSHPDVRMLKPASATGYLVEQAREVVRDAVLAPVRSSRKAYVIAQAEMLRGASANALLKTLEEPPGDVVIIMLAAGEQAVLETVRSRCQVLACTAPSSIAQGSFETDEMLRAIAEGASTRQLLAFARRLVELSEEGADELKTAQEAELEAGADYLGSAARKAMEQRHKRELAAHKRQALERIIGSMRAYLRDCLAIAVDAADLAAAQGMGAKTAVAVQAGPAGVLAALVALDRAVERISYNVTSQLAMEAMLLEIKEALCPQLP